MWVVSLIILMIGFAANSAAIYDPNNIFCGSLNCYEVLGVSRESSAKDIKRAYRTISLSSHPDKSKDPNATENFRVISKAYEVLRGNESRTLFDYYLDHPKDYFKVSGQHYYKQLPKSDVWVVLAVVTGLLSWLVYTVQLQRWQKAINYLKVASANKLSLKEGGTVQTLDLHQRACALYESEVQKAKASGNTSAGKGRMMTDPIFLQCIDQVVSKVEIEGGYRKPIWSDIFAIQLVIFPYTLFKWCLKYYRRNISGMPLSDEEKLEMAIEAVGSGTWHLLPETEKVRLLELEIWNPLVRERLQSEARISSSADDEVVIDDEELVDSTGKHQSMKKSKKSQNRKKKN